MLGAFTLFVLFLTITITASCSQRSARQDALADSVKTEFLHAWQGYKKYAWGYDYLKPLSKIGANWYDSSFVITPVDAFDTMILMGLNEEAQQAKTLIFKTLSFNRDIPVKVFEFNIRLLGGLLSAYQLDGDPRFLQLALNLGRRLLPAFDSPTGMPYRYVNLKTGQCSGNISNPAEIGTYIVEFGMLTHFSGDSIFYRKAKKAVTALYHRRSAISLVGTTINIETGTWVDKSSHISAMIDSYYEYLLKGFLLFNDPDFGEMWKRSVNAVNTYLADEYHDDLWYGRVDMETGKFQKPWFGALDAFFPAVLSLDGQMDRAHALLQSCHKMWQMQGVEPDLINYREMRILAPGYPLRPEIMESTYYLYYFTGDASYRRTGRIYFEALKKYCRTEAGYAGLKNVINKEKDDRMESYFFAETLKYLYLLFSSPRKINLSKVIFNTEGHLMSTEDRLHK